MVLRAPSLGDREQREKPLAIAAREALGWEVRGVRVVVEEQERAAEATGG